jgi:hypothetical protein
MTRRRRAGTQRRSATPTRASNEVAGAGSGPEYGLVVSVTPTSARFAYEVADDALREQLARIDSLDQKASIILAGGGIIGGLVLAPGGGLAIFPSWLAISVVVALVTTLLCTFAAVANRRYQLAPTPNRVAALSGADEDRLRWMFIGNLLEAIEINRGKLRTKTRWLTASQIALFATIFQLGAYSVWQEMTR